MKKLAGLALFLSSVFAVSMSHGASQINTREATLVATVEGSEFSSQIFTYKDIQSIYLTGTFGTYDSGAVKSLISKLKPGFSFLFISIDFGGGFDGPTKTFIRGTRNFCQTHGCKVITYVGPRAECTSYCTPLFMLGEARVADPQSKFGFHSSSIFGLIPFSEVIKNDNIRYGVNPNWMKKNERLFSRMEITYLLPDQLEGSNIVTRVMPQAVLERLIEDDQLSLIF